MRRRLGFAFPVLPLLSLSLFSLLALRCSTAAPPAASTPASDVRMVPDEAYAVLTILDKRHLHEPILEADWGQVFESEGYVRLKAREHSMQREFEDSAFREFVMSDELMAKREDLASTLQSWLAADVTHARDLALAYLPKNARLRAKVYPVIKPKGNSFVFDLEGDPAIFMYIEPLPREVFEATIAHELHHVGFAASCPPADEQWISGFGEGIATLAAAGGPSGVPQKRPEVAAEWKKQMALYDQNFHAVEDFLSAVAKGELTGEAETKRGFEFFGMVGPWYTVGWKMSVVIEETLGRDTLIQSSCHGRELLRTYNRAVPLWKVKTGEDLPLWSQTLTAPKGSGL